MIVESVIVEDIATVFPVVIEPLCIVSNKVVNGLRVFLNFGIFAKMVDESHNLKIIFFLHFSISE